MKEIKVSEKLRGARRWAAVERARKRIRDGESYLIRRHGAWFRPGAHGYTTYLGSAGIFDGAEARKYIDVEGLSVVSLKEAEAEAISRIQELAAALEREIAVLAKMKGETAPHTEREIK